MTLAMNVLISALLISFASWLSGRFPTAAGFVVAMPVTTMIVLPLSQLQHGSTENTVVFAKSILLAIPITILFFVPFLVAGRLSLSFWHAYALGCLLLPCGYFLHRLVARVLF